MANTTSTTRRTLVQNWGGTRSEWLSHSTENVVCLRLCRPFSVRTRHRILELLSRSTMCLHCDMNRGMDPRVTELHCIMPIENLQSVMQHGLLSYERAAKLPHHSVALQPIQDKRDQKQVPGGRRLHQYANLYFHARNPMLFKRLGEVSHLCVLSVSVDVLQIHGVVITDQNAASDYVRFLHPSQWGVLSFDDIYAMDWRHPNDPIAYFRHRSRKCAEVLVPDRIDAALITRAYVADSAVSAQLQALGCSLSIVINPVLFFR